MSRPLSSVSKRPQPNYQTDSTIDSQGNRLANNHISAKPATHPPSSKGHKSSLSDSLRKSSRGSTFLGNDASNNAQQTAVRDHEKTARDINLNRLGLNEIPTNLTQMPLTAIHITHNRIRSIEQPFSSTMAAVLHLDLSFNMLKVFPDSVQTSLSSLSSLNLSFNRLEVFPVGRGMMKNLTILKVTGNYLTAIPIHVKSSNIKRIEIEWKLFTKQPSELAQFAGLDQCNQNELYFNSMELTSYMQENKDLTLYYFLGQHILSINEAALVEYLDCCLKLSACSIFVQAVKQRAEAIEHLLPDCRLNILKKMLQCGDEALLEQLGLENFKLFLQGLSKASLYEMVQDYLECR
jgi:Leucine-rich repeat (LRR) protein